MPKIRAHDVPTWFDLILAFLVFSLISVLFGYFMHLQKKMDEANKPIVEQKVEKQ